MNTEITPLHAVSNPVGIGEVTFLDQAMSSVEIAGLTGKRHTDVVVDIKNVLNQAGIEGAENSAPFKMPSGQTTTVYNLPRHGWL